MTGGVKCDSFAHVNSLAAYISLLQSEREIVEIDVPVSADLEIAEIHRRVIACGGPALLFNNVEGADFPCVTNLFGTPKRVDLAFGKRPGKFLKQLTDAAHDLASMSAGKCGVTATWQPRGSRPASRPFAADRSRSAASSRPTSSACH